MTTIYGVLPVDLGLIDISPVEMMFWQYCPISTCGSNKITLPKNLSIFKPIVDAVIENAQDEAFHGYIYITAKVLYISGNYIGNRPGWHCDGFGTGDLNYIWYDREPTEFIQGNFDLTTDCNESLAEMERIAENSIRYTFPEKHLLKLDSRVIHRSPIEFKSGVRAFVKISISKNKYNLIGNSINHDIGELWEMYPRSAERNHPSFVPKITQT